MDKSKQKQKLGEINNGLHSACTDLKKTPGWRLQTKLERQVSKSSTQQWYQTPRLCKYSEGEILDKLKLIIKNEVPQMISTLIVVNIAQQIIVESLWCTPEINVTLYINYSNKNKKVQKKKKLAEIDSFQRL